MSAASIPAKNFTERSFQLLFEMTVETGGSDSLTREDLGQGSSHTAPQLRDLSEHCRTEPFRQLP
jgi:hypothetical protein